MLAFSRCLFLWRMCMTVVFFCLLKGIVGGRVGVFILGGIDVSI